MKANVRKAALPKGTLAGMALGHRVETLEVIEIGGSDNRHLLAPLLGFAEFNRDGLATLDNLHKPSKRRLEGLTILSVGILHYKGSGGLHTNPFEREFPAEWTEQWLHPNYAVNHLTVNDWFDVAAGLKPEILSQYLVKGMVDVWCGAPELGHASGQEVTLFKMRVDGDRMVLCSQKEHARPVSVRGFVLFGLTVAVKE